MALQTFRHAAKLSPSGRRQLDRLRAMLLLFYNVALEDCTSAWRKSGKEPGFPWFRARSRYCSFSVDDPESARNAVRNRYGGRRGELRMKGLPRMRFLIRRTLPPLDRLRGFRVVHKARRVEVQLLFEQLLPAVRTDAPERPVGLDAGIRSLATLSDSGRSERRRKPAARSAIRRKQRAVSRSRRGSKSRGKKKAALARAHERQAETGRQELHRFADHVVQCNDFNAVEALRTRNMLRKGKNKRGLNRAIAEQGWGEFFDIPKCNAESAGIPFVEVPPAGTSQDCSRYGTRILKAVPERVHRCCVSGQERVEARPARFRRGRGSGWDRAWRTRGFRGALSEGAENRPHRSCAMRQAAPGSETATLGLA